MRHKAREVMVDGRPMVAVSAKDFESLLAMRRQLGSQTAKMRALRDALVDMTEFLDGLAAELDGESPAEPHDAFPPLGPRHRQAALVAEIRRRAHRVRAVTGAGRASDPRRPRTPRPT
ncbi:hypothetical protein ACHBTE_00390 [Streptomyces sp. M41]|uniref:hypothetical protein n=1 Tax=Streptomyces sp. M41 TaxID=3059412 RepID=UPI00374D9928